MIVEGDQRACGRGGARVACYKVGTLYQQERVAVWLVRPRVYGSAARTRGLVRVRVRSAAHPRPCRRPPPRCACPCACRRT
eukprot:scaffold87313_cov57-Phaeocystis_antarctica.AAC.1